MLQIVKVIKWVSLPVLLVAAMFSLMAGRYEFLVTVMICLGAAIAVRREVAKEKYFWAAGFTSIALIFSPFLLITKIFLLIGLAGVTIFLTLLTAFRPVPRTAEAEIR